MMNFSSWDLKIFFKMQASLVDNSLRWNRQVKQLKVECNSRMNLLKHLSHTAWGEGMKTLKMVYQYLIKSKLENGDEIYE